jgi:hypothetical protein
VCQSGATSGEICDLVIQELDRRQWSNQLGLYVRDVVQAEQAAAHGPVDPATAAGRCINAVGRDLPVATDMDRPEARLSNQLDEEPRDRRCRRAGRTPGR